LSSVFCKNLIISKELEDATTYQSKWNAEEEGHPHDLLS
jgi:hypothetical protein